MRLIPITIMGAITVTIFIFYLFTSFTNFNILSELTLHHLEIESASHPTWHPPELASARVCLTSELELHLSIPELATRLSWPQLSLEKKLR